MDSKVLTASGAAVARRCKVHTIILSGGSNSATAIFYDDASGTSGTEIARLNATAGISASADLKGRFCNNGVYVAITGTSPNVTVVHN